MATAPATIASRPARWSALPVAGAVLGAVAILLPLAGNPYHVTVAVNLCITLILTLSLNLVTGLSGQFHLSHAAFFGLGAYIPAMLAKHLGLSPWLGLPASIASVALLAAAVGVPVTRLTGLYLAVTTLAFSLFVEVLVNQGGPITGGGYGLQDYPAAEVLGLQLRGKAFYPLAAGALLLVLLILRNLKHSKLGREIIAVRDHPEAAAAAGINPPVIRLVALVVSAALAAFAGWLHAYYHLTLNPSLLSPELTFVWLFMVLVGGLGHTPGVILGTILLTLVPELLGVATGQTILGIGVLLILVTLFAPQGLGGIIDRLRRPAGGRSADG